MLREALEGIEQVCGRLAGCAHARCATPAAAAAAAAHPLTRRRRASLRTPPAAQARAAWHMALDQQRNRVLRVNLFVSISSLSAVLASLPAAYFGAPGAGPRCGCAGASGWQSGPEGVSVGGACLLG